MSRPEIIFIVGPTAVGKSRVAVELAKKINAEIISCDSMQIYKGMDIITSCPPAKLRRDVPHHLVSVVVPQREFNVTQYRRTALGALHRIIKKGKPVIFVGGTGLYMSVLIDGIFIGGGEDRLLRSRLYRLAEKKGSSYIYKKLVKVDPDAASRIHPNDRKRIVRALEVYQSTGKPISVLQRQRRGLAGDYDIKSFYLDLNRQEIYRRINSRLQDMFEDGLIKEVKRLLEIRLSRTARSCLGIKEISDYLGGRRDLESTKERIKRNTRNYAKRQISWFRRDKRIQWIKIKKSDSPKEIAKNICQMTRHPV